MRIISGLYKSRKIVAPKNLPVRPTTDMAKESLFNIINNLYYSDEQFAKIPELIFQNNILLKDGLLVVEHSKHTKLEHLEHFAYSKSYGGNVFSFFEKD